MPWLVIISPAYSTPRNGRRERFIWWTVGTRIFSSTRLQQLRRSPAG